MVILKRLDIEPSIAKIRSIFLKIVGWNSKSVKSRRETLFAISNSKNIEDWVWMDSNNKPSKNHS